MAISQERRDAEKRIAKLEGEVTHQREKYAALMRKANELEKQLAVANDSRAGLIKWRMDCEAHYGKLEKREAVLRDYITVLEAALHDLAHSAEISVDDADGFLASKYVFERADYALKYKDRAALEAKGQGE